MIACVGGSCGSGSLGAGDICPGPVYGYARVDGTVLYADGTPAVGKVTFVNCENDVVGYDDVTDGEGRFTVRPAYSTYDTITVPLPPRGPDGSFDLSCEANSRIRPETVVRESLAVRFTPTQQGVITSTVQLQEPGP
ncbi:MAG TPA: hypothetical protein VFS51_07580 [Gemmatimonadales bacterium]|nr:hypothetical protein [Gemmatimonadales bacterium]